MTRDTRTAKPAVTRRQSQTGVTRIRTNTDTRASAIRVMSNNLPARPPRRSSFCRVNVPCGLQPNRNPPKKATAATPAAVAATRSLCSGYCCATLLLVQLAKQPLAEERALHHHLREYPLHRCHGRLLGQHPLAHQATQAAASQRCASLPQGCGRRPPTV